MGVLGRACLLVSTRRQTFRGGGGVGMCGFLEQMEGTGPSLGTRLGAVGGLGTCCLAGSSHPEPGVNSTLEQGMKGS